jgi:hypothetical protein
MGDLYNNAKSIGESFLQTYFSVTDPSVNHIIKLKRTMLNFTEMILYSPSKQKFIKDLMISLRNYLN